MWSWFGMSLATASRVSDWANAALLVSLIVGVVSTFLVVTTAGIKEAYWDQAREASEERVAKAEQRAEELRSANLSLQKVVRPRHIALKALGFTFDPSSTSLSGEDPFAPLKAFSGTKVFIQAVPDFESQTLAQEVLIALTLLGWHPQVVSERETHIPSSVIFEGVRVAFPSEGKIASAAEALGEALSKAGLRGPKTETLKGVWVAPYADGPSPWSADPSLVPPRNAVTVLIGAKPVPLVALDGKTP